VSIFVADSIFLVCTMSQTFSFYYKCHILTFSLISA